MPIPNNNQISLSGEFAVLSHLYKIGLDATLTLGNTKSVDILVISNNKLIKLEVKTSRDNLRPRMNGVFGLNYSWRLSKKNEQIMEANLFYCFVNINIEMNTYNFYIIPSKIVAKYLTKAHKTYLEKTNNKDTLMRQFMLGFKGEEYKNIPEMPLAENWENNWEFHTEI